MADYRVDEIKEGIYTVGIKRGDSIFIHSNLGFFGRLENCKSGTELCQAFYHTILDVVGEEGTLVVPTFSYSFCHGEMYSRWDTKSKCGMFSSFVMEQQEAIRSNDPNFSVTAVGKNAVLFTENPPHESFGKNSFWERFYKVRGKIVCMNFDHGSTFVHYVEKCNNVSYRYNKAFNGSYVEQDGVKKDYYVHYVYDLVNEEDKSDVTRLNQLCREQHISKITKLGKGTLLAFDSNTYYNLITKELKKNPRFLTKGGVGVDGG